MLLKLMELNKEQWLHSLSNEVIHFQKIEYSHFATKCAFNRFLFLQRALFLVETRATLAFLTAIKLLLQQKQLPVSIWADVHTARLVGDADFPCTAIDHGIRPYSIWTFH